MRRPLKSRNQESERRETQVRKEEVNGGAGWMAAHTDRRPVTGWSVTIGILSPPGLRKEHPGSTALFCQKKTLIQRQHLSIIYSVID